MKELLIELQETLKAIGLCTQPIDEHTDPKSVNDCWAIVNDKISTLLLIAEANALLLARAEQMKTEQEAVIANINSDLGFEIHKAKSTLIGIERIVNLIKRHQ